MRMLAHIMIMALFVAAQAQAQTPVSASVSAQRVVAGEVFHFTISANGGDVKEPDISVLASTGANVGTPSVQSSTSIQTVQGRTSVMQSRAWRYPVSIDREGTFTFPRVAVVVDGNDYLTPQLTVEVSRAVDMGSGVSGGRQEITVDDLAFVRAVTDKTTVFQGEAIVLRLRLYVLEGHYVNVEGPRSLPMPATEGFLAGPQWQATVHEQYMGRSYQITEFNQVLYPAMPGELTIGPWNWQGGVRWHNARRQMQRAARLFNTNPIPINVLPLPERPADFSGAVGRWRMEAHLAQNQVTQGTPVRLTLAISGEGNPNAIGAPILPELPWAHVSGPESEAQQSDSSAEATKTYSYLITPLEPGEHVIPSVAFTYFAPMIRNYKTERTGELSVSVAPAAGSETFVAIGGSAEEQRRRIQVHDGDLHPIETHGDALKNRKPANGGRMSPLALASPAVPLVLYGLVYAVLARRRRLSGDAGYARRYYASSKWAKALEAARNASDPTETLARALTGYIGDMLNINDAGLTSGDVETLLSERINDAALVAMTTRVLRACERARYAGRDSAPAEEEALFDATREVVEQLGKTLRENPS